MEKSFENVDLDLKFDYHGSDWGIINADASRVKEFIFYEKNNIFEKGVKSSFIELIIASMNDAILENKVDYEIRFLFSEYLYSIEQTEYHLMLIAYWVSIKDNDEFPVGFLIEELFDIKDK